jgi:hypothetical protein
MEEVRGSSPLSSTVKVLVRWLFVRVLEAIRTERPRSASAVSRSPDKMAKNPVK